MSICLISRKATHKPRRPEQRLSQPNPKTVGANNHLPLQNARNQSFRTDGARPDSTTHTKNEKRCIGTSATLNDRMLYHKQKNPPFLTDSQNHTFYPNGANRVNHSTLIFSPIFTPADRVLTEPLLSVPNIPL